MDPLKKNIRSLTSLRFFAAGLVFFYHLAYFTKDKTFSEALWIFSSQGFSGVAFFFILSGFILAYNYQGKLFTSDAKAIKAFYVARFARIYPTHLLFFILSLPLMVEFFLQSPAKTLIKGLSQILLIQSYYPSTTFSQTFNPLSWSICNEVFFYFLFPCILTALALMRRRGVWFWFAGAAGIWIFVMIVAAFFGNQPFSNWMLYFFPGFRLFDFIFGMLIFEMFSRATPATNKKCSLFFTWMELAALGFLFLSYYYADQVPQPYRWSVYFMPSMGFLIYIFAFSKGFFSNFLSLPVLVLLGEISYSFYMCHVLLLQYGTKYEVLDLPFVSRAFRAPVILVVIIGFSFLCYTCYELPMKRWIKNKG